MFCKSLLACLKCRYACDFAFVFSRCAEELEQIVKKTYRSGAQSGQSNLSGLAESRFLCLGEMSPPAENLSFLHSCKTLMEILDCWLEFCRTILYLIAFVPQITRRSEQRTAVQNASLILAKRQTSERNELTRVRVGEYGRLSLFPLRLAFFPLGYHFPSRLSFSPRGYDFPLASRVLQVSHGDIYFNR